MFDTLMGLPLFRGVSRERMSDAVGVHKFHFRKYLPDQPIFEAGAPCTELSFVISGNVRIRIENPDGRFCVFQTLRAPEVIAPEFLYGLRTSYPGSVRSIDTVSLLSISKADYLAMLDSDHVFLLNYLNLLAVGSQKSMEGILAVSTGNLPERIAFWISALTQPRACDIVLRCSRHDLASLFGVQRSSVIRALDSMAERGLLTYTPGEISIPDRAAVLALLDDHAESPD